MRYLALASDYDGTVAHDGLVDANTVEALKRFRQSGRKLILVTGRELADLEKVFPELGLFDRIVAENGALVFNPTTRESRTLAHRPPDRFIADLKAHGVPALSVGEVILATWRPHEQTVLESIQRLGLDLQVIFNKDAVMVLPTGVNKMTGLKQALGELKLSRHNVAGVGDAENDLSFLSCCECSVAVSNAIPSLKQTVDFLVDGARGAGVAQLIEHILQDDLRGVPRNDVKRGIRYGSVDDRGIYLNAHDTTILLCGQSGGGKSMLVAGLLESLTEREYQTCLVDPEGDYEGLEGFLTLGDESAPPSIDQIFQLLSNPDLNLLINLISVKMQDRPIFFASLLNRLQEKQLHEGRPHWLVVDEAHHLLPSSWAPASVEVAGQTASMVLVTVHPAHVSEAALRLVNVLTVIGKEPKRSAEEFAKGAGIETPAIPTHDLDPGEASVWFRDSNEVIKRMRWVPGRAEHQRHRRKYAEGELEAERVFYFRGPHGKLNLRAQNLNLFLQLAAGIDDETWLFHLHRGDYSRWLASAVKDPELAKIVASIEKNRSMPPAQTRQEIAKAIEAKYTAPA
jgi:HAD superfamily hydrolase (TIGR01484 family)